MKTCSQCGFESTEAANFCSNCGKRFETVASDGVAEKYDGLSLVVLNKGFREKYDGYEDFITVTLQFQNTGAKEIRAFKAAIEFYDLFEKRIAGLNFQVEKPLRCGETRTDTFLWKYNQFIDFHQTLRFTDLSNLVPRCPIIAVIFTDGTRFVAESG